MFLSFLVRGLLSRWAQSNRRGSFRPRLECLEDRRLLTAGVLDPTFGSGGIVTPSLAGTNAVLIQSNNDIVLAGYTTSANGTFTSAVRYTPSGTLDTTFGSGGTEVSNVAGGEGAAALYPAVAPQLTMISSRPSATKSFVSPPTAALTRHSARTAWRRCLGPATLAASLFRPTVTSS